MTTEIQTLKPEKVFHYFNEIAKIPHGSYNTEAIADYCLDVAKQCGVPAVKDGAGNVIATLEASPGREGAAPVVLQGHLDMVCEKEEGHAHNFEKDPLALTIDGDYLTAEGTTLGGDDGIAVAMCLALMAEKDQIVHPKTIIVLTVEEEVGMDGAYALDPAVFDGAKRLINIDSEEEGIATIGCAGGSEMGLKFPVTRTDETGLIVSLAVGALQGGHSGMSIHRFGYNADILLGNILFSLGKDITFKIADLSGGNKVNAIPQSAKAHIVINPEDREKLGLILSRLQENLRQSAEQGDKNLFISARFGDLGTYDVMDPESEKRCLMALNIMPDGVQSMGRVLAGRVDTSLNLGIMKTTETTFELITHLRSNVDNDRDLLGDKIEAFTKYLGGTAVVTGVYPAWTPKSDSPLYTVMNAENEKLFGTPLVKDVTHGGLECALFAKKCPDMDIISIGPNILDVHTPAERLSISSTERVWQLVTATLAALAE